MQARGHTQVALKPSQTPTSTRRALRRGAPSKATEQSEVVADGVEVAKTWLRGGSATLH